MGIGGSILNKYGGLPEPEPPTKDTPRRAAFVLLAGLAILSGFASAAWYSTQGLKIFQIFSLIVVVAGLLVRTWQGWGEDGFLGALYRWRRPLGSAFVGDHARSPLARTIEILVLLTILALLLVSALRPPISPIP